jgi:hypothetical protein
MKHHHECRKCAKRWECEWEDCKDIAKGLCLECW